MSIQRCPNDKKSPYIMLDNRIINDPRMTFEAIGVYGMLVANAIEINEIPEDIISILIEVGYLVEEKE